MEQLNNFMNLKKQIRHLNTIKSPLGKVLNDISIKFDISEKEQIEINSSKDKNDVYAIVLSAVNVTEKDKSVFMDKLGDAQTETEEELREIQE